MGISCQYLVPGVNSDSPMDVFRILRVVFLRSTSSSGAARPSDAVDYLPLNYEMFCPEPLQQIITSRPGIHEPAEKMRDTFSKVMTYLRNSGNEIVTYACK